MSSVSKIITKVTVKKVVQTLRNIFLVLFSLNALSVIYLYFFGTIIHAVDFNEEMNFPTAFATFQLAISGYLLWWIAKKKYAVHDKFRHQWRGLSIIFYFLALDEIGKIHDNINIGTAGGWVGPYLVLTAVVGLSFLYFLIKLPKKTRNLVTLGAFLFVAGAIGMELVGVHLKNIGFGRGHMYYRFCVTFEETLEFVGILIFIKALLDYITTEYGEFRKEFRKSAFVIKG